MNRLEAEDVRRIKEYVRFEKVRRREKRKEKREMDVSKIDICVVKGSHK